MSKNSNNIESRDGNKFKFLKAQLCTISGLLYDALENLNNALKKLDEWKEISKKKVEE